MSSTITEFLVLDDSFERLKQTIFRTDTTDVNDYNEETNDLISSIRNSDVPGASTGLSFMFRDRAYPDWYRPKPKDHIENLHLWTIDDERANYEARVKSGIRNKMLPLLGVRLHYSHTGRAVAYVFPNDALGANALVSGNGEKPELYMHIRISDKISK